MKERKSSNTTILDRNFNGLNLDEIRNDKSVRRAVSDAIDLGEKIVKLNDLSTYNTDEIERLTDSTWEKKQEFEDNNVGDEKYIDTFNVLVNGFFNSEQQDGISGFDRLNMLKNVLNEIDGKEEVIEESLGNKRVDLVHEDEVDVFGNGFQKIKGLLTFGDLFRRNTK